MRTQPWHLIALTITIFACQKRGAENTRDTSQAQPRADSPAAASPARTPAPADTSAPAPAPAPAAPGALAKGKEPGTIPATPTPTVTSDNAIATMREHLQRLDSASVESLESGMKQHSKMLGDLLTTMRVEVQAATSPTKNSWLASADTAENELDRLALAHGEALKTSFREHKTRVLRLLDGFRALVPKLM